MVTCKQPFSEVRRLGARRGRQVSWLSAIVWRRVDVGVSRHHHECIHVENRFPGPTTAGGDSHDVAPRKICLAGPGPARLNPSLALLVLPCMHGNLYIGLLGNARLASQRLPEKGDAGPRKRKTSKLTQPLSNFG